MSDALDYVCQTLSSHHWISFFKSPFFLLFLPHSFSLSYPILDPPTNYVPFLLLQVIVNSNTNGCYRGLKFVRFYGLEEYYGNVWKK